MAGQPQDRPQLPQISPQRERLESECALFREELARLHCEREHLRGTVGPNLEAEYQLKIGTKQLELLTAQLEYRALRRKIELWQTALNRGLRPSEQEIEWVLQRELERWREGVAEQQAAVARAKARLEGLSSSEDSREVRTLYRRLALRLHPDVNPGYTAQTHALWMQVVAAYHAGDLNELRALWILAKEVPEGGYLDLPDDQLTATHESLKRGVRHLLDELAAMRAAPPHSLAELLDDEDWVAARRQEMQDEIDQLGAKAAHLRVALAELLRSGHDERRPDAN